MSVFAYETPEGESPVEFEFADNQLTVGGKTYPCDGRCVWIAGRRTPFWAYRAGDKVSVWLDGEVFTFTHRDPRRREGAGASAMGASSNQVQAQMPGKILLLAVRPGQKVSQGQNLLVMESMKMELALDASRDGEVEAVEVAVGQLVTQGQLLIRLKALPD